MQSNLYLKSLQHSKNIKKYTHSTNSNATDSITPEINSAKNAFELINHNLSQSIDTNALADSVLNGFSSAIANIGKDAINGFKINNSKINGKGPKGGILAQLIQLILTIVKLPVRFKNLFLSMGFAGAALGLGIGGIVKSIALGTKDLYMLLVAILQIVFKYSLCIVSFTITTTFGGCIFTHFITLLFVMLHLLIMYIVDTINDNIGIDFSFIVDFVFDFIQWPSTIQTLCYTCFGKPIKLRDIISDVGVIEGIGNQISFDFNNVMPTYMRPSIPFGQKSLRSLDKAMN